MGEELLSKSELSRIVKGFVPALPRLNKGQAQAIKNISVSATGACSQAERITWPPKALEMWIQMKKVGNLSNICAETAVYIYSLTFVEDREITTCERITVLYSWVLSSWDIWCDSTGERWFIFTIFMIAASLLYRALKLKHMSLSFF